MMMCQKSENSQVFGWVKEEKQTDGRQGQLSHLESLRYRWFMVKASITLLYWYLLFLEEIVGGPKPERAVYS